MAHVRQQIIDNLATTLTGLTTTGPRVYPSRVDPLRSDEVPGLLIYDTDETIDEEQSTLQAQFRNPIMVIEGHAEAASGDAISDLLNLIASEIETAIFVDITRNDKALATFYSSTSKTYDASADKVVGVIRMEFITSYMTETGVPDVPLT